MPGDKSAQKQGRATERKRLENKSVRSRSKTSITKAERLIFAGELEAAKGAVVTAISSLDRAAKKGRHPPQQCRPPQITFDEKAK